MKIITRPKMDYKQVYKMLMDSRHEIAKIDMNQTLNISRLDWSRTVCLSSSQEASCRE